MPVRRSSESQHERIVRSTLALLGDAPAVEITTRRVAREAGVGHATVLRRFRSRPALLAGASAHVREELDRRAVEALERADAPLAAVAALTQGLVSFAAEHPGLLRLLFPEAGAAAVAPTAGILSTERLLASELVRRAQQSAEVDAGADPDRAASLLIAALQGLLLEWQSSGRGDGLPRDAASLLDVWTAGLRAGQPARSPAESKVPEAPADTPRPALASLDVRPLARAGGDALGAILAALRRLPDDGVLTILAPARPDPLLALLALLASSARHAEVRERRGEGWEVEVRGPAAPPIEDLRALEAPGPLERILEATAKLSPGEGYAARTPRHPRMLLPRLAERGFHFEVHDEPDGSALVLVRRPA